MTKEELAAKLNGREIGAEITRAEEAEAKAAGLVVLYGASDDLAEFRGAISEEEGCYDGGTFPLDREGLLGARPELRDDDDEDAESGVLRWLGRKKTAARIEALWCPEGPEGSDAPSWAYRTEIPHATFEVMEEGDVYCRGIVFSLGDLPEAP